MKHIFFYIIVIFAASLCFHTNTMAMSLFDNRTVMEKEFEGAPDWITKGCSSYFKNNKDDEILCGVGSSLNKNPSDARTIAVIKARAEIAGNIQTHVTGILKDYSMTTTGREEFPAGDYQRIEDFSTQITQMTLYGTKVVDFWVSKNGTLYALVMLTNGQFKDSVHKMNGLSGNLKDNIIKNAEKSFKQIDNVK
ncbi:MAG TPA: LPP20 family lipoprotein [Smithella sp.]|nr:LPP20 family lipoprotein [Smithella sp.]